MAVKLLAFLALAAFYVSYFGKMVSQSRRGVHTDQLGKGSKPRNVILIEWMVKILSILAVAAQIASMLLLSPTSNRYAECAGLALIVSAAAIFYAAARTMHDSWRAGLPEKKTRLVTGGIYTISRNPAFLAFDMTYIGTLAIFFNIPLLIISIATIIVFHLQILHEEQYLSNTFGKEYAEYKQSVGRYIWKI